MKSTTKKRLARQVKSTTFEIDIAQEFKDVKNEIAGLARDVRNWQSIFESKLTELNANMKGVLERLTAHDYRFTEHDSRLRKLEQNDAKQDGHTAGMSEGKKFMWTIAKTALAVGAVLGTLGFGGWILKFLAIV